MRVVLLRSECGNTRTCPNINKTDRGSYVVQGYTVPRGPGLPDGEREVRIPRSLVPELASTIRPPTLRTGREYVVIRGAEVTDREVLAELDMPVGENAVEIPVSALPELACADVE